VWSVWRRNGGLSKPELPSRRNAADGKQQNASAMTYAAARRALSNLRPRSPLEARENTLYRLRRSREGWGRSLRLKVFRSPQKPPKHPRLHRKKGRSTALVLRSLRSP
jgi:hypothetical protein